MRNGQGKPIITWPTITGESYDALKELRTRAVEAERRLKRTEGEAKETLLDAKTTLTDAKNIRSDITKAIINISKASQRVSARARDFGEVLPPMNISERDSFEQMDAVFTNWLGLVATAFNQVAIKARREGRATGRGGGGSGGGGKGGNGAIPDEYMLETPAREPANPNLPKSPYEMIITLCKAVAGACGRTGLDRIINKAALPLSDRKERTLEADAQAAAVFQYLSDKADTKTAPGSGSAVVQGEAEDDGSVAARISADMESAETFDAALERMLTSQMFATVVSGLDRLRSVNVDASTPYRDMSAVQILTSKTLLPQLMRLFSGLFRRTERQSHGSRSVADSRDAQDRDDADIAQAEFVLFSGMRKQLPAQFKFSGTPPEDTKDNTWMWEHFVAVKVATPSSRGLPQLASLQRTLLSTAAVAAPSTFAFFDS